jgi:Protein of unknown function (DUF1672).
LKTLKLVISTLILSLLLGGCSILENDHQANSAAKKEQEKQLGSQFMSVQKYTGQGYSLSGGEENDKIAEAHRTEVVKAAEQFFLKKYKTKVKVHNLVGNRDGVTVFVESIGEPHFHTFAVVPISNNKDIMGDEVFSQEGQVEDAIRSGIYAMAYSNEIQKLNNYLDGVIQKYPIVGKSQKEIENVGIGGYSSPYYYITALDSAFKVNIIDMYLKHPNWNKGNWKNALIHDKVDSKKVWITVQLFMTSYDQKPDKSIFNHIISDIEGLDNLPPAAYSVLLHDNRIQKKSGNGQKTNSLERGVPHEIIKY